MTSKHGRDTEVKYKQSINSFMQQFHTTLIPESSERRYKLRHSKRRHRRHIVRHRSGRSDNNRDFPGNECGIPQCRLARKQCRVLRRPERTRQPWCRSTWGRVTQLHSENPRQILLPQLFRRQSFVHLLWTFLRRLRGSPHRWENRCTGTSAILSDNMPGRRTFMVRTLGRNWTRFHSG